MKAILTKKLLTFFLLSLSLVSCSKDDATPQSTVSLLMKEWKVAGIYNYGTNIVASPDKLYAVNTVSIYELDPLNPLNPEDAEGYFRAMIFYEEDYNGITATRSIFLSGTFKLIQDNIIRVTTTSESKTIDIKIKKIDASTFIFEFEDEYKGLLRVNCIPNVP